MTYRTKYKSAFTMVELVFVIVVLGIVSSLGASIITQVFESYIIQRAQYRANIKNELAINQIGNRLRYAIASTVGVRESLGSVFVPSADITEDDMRVLQWVAYDGDSFEAITSNNNRLPGWSGFCDIDDSNSTSISTPGSNLSLANTIITNLGGSMDKAVIYFSGVPQDESMHDINSVSVSTITLDTAIPLPNNISERYRLAWTSYALEVDSNNDLILHYSFAPTVGAYIAGDSEILLRDVSNFRFMAGDGVFRIKICTSERIGADINATIHSCKEKVVF